MTDLNQLLLTIRLLKAEGVAEYRTSEFSIRFTQEPAAAGSTLSHQPAEAAPRPEAGRSAGAEDAEGAIPRENGVFSSDAASADGTPGELAHPVLRKLNPNYAKLTGFKRA